MTPKADNLKAEIPIKRGQTLQTKIFRTWLFLFLKFRKVPQESFTINQVNQHDPRNKNI